MSIVTFWAIVISIVIFLVPFSILLFVARRILAWIESGGFYYNNYPAAKILDEANAKGQLKPEDTMNIILRLGEANIKSEKDFLTEMQSVRAELDSRPGQ